MEVTCQKLFLPAIADTVEFKEFFHGENGDVFFRKGTWELEQRSHGTADPLGAAAEAERLSDKTAEEYDVESVKIFSGAKELF